MQRPGGGPLKKRRGPGGLDLRGSTGPERPVNWRHIDRSLCENYHLTPHGIDQMTLPEICLLLEDANASSSSMSTAEMDEELRRWHGMTNRQRLENARHG